MQQNAVIPGIDDYLENARPLAEQTAEAADRIDRDRQMPGELANALADGGFFRLLLPKSLGGAEMAHPDFLRILQAFAPADASVAWCLNQNNVFSTSAVMMDRSTAREIWTNPRAVVTNGPPTAASIAVPVKGGYRLSGHWNFSSGSDHATWIAALAPIGQPGQVLDAARNRAGSRMLLMPKEDVKFVDLWQVFGLRGTGSFSFQVDEMFIPEHRTYQFEGQHSEPGPLYAIPRTLLFGSGFATVALGVARRSLEIAIEAASTRAPGRSSTVLREQQPAQRQVGEAHAIHRSAQCFLQESVNTVWESASRDGTIPVEQRLQLRVAATHALRMSAQVVDIAYNLCGAGAIFASNPIQRRFQDMHVITQHVQASYAHYESAGQALLGLEARGAF